jgi:hypothetical protein
MGNHDSYSDFEVHAALRLIVRESLITFDGRTTRVTQTCQEYMPLCSGPSGHAED